MNNAIMNHGEKPQLAYLPTSSLVVDARYQRKIGGRGKKLIRKIRDNFHWNFFGIVVVTDNGDGSYGIIDGQHRVEAARDLAGVNTVPCFICAEMTFKEQAQAFVRINADSLRLNGYQIFHAAVKAGDERAVGLNKLLARVGLEVTKGNPAKDTKNTGKIACIGVLQKMFYQSPIALEQALRAVQESCGNSAVHFKYTLIQAAFDTLKTGVDEERLTSIIRQNASDHWLSFADRNRGKQSRRAYLAGFFIEKVQ